jgi:hypothetical protein
MDDVYLPSLTLASHAPRNEKICYSRSAESPSKGGGDASMAVFIISYDLRAPGRDYKSLYDAIKTVPYAHPLESVWLVEHNGPASVIKDTLKGHIDKNDGVVVIEFTKDADWALFGINKPSSDWIQSMRP